MQDDLRIEAFILRPPASFVSTPVSPSEERMQVIRFTDGSLTLPVFRYRCERCLTG
jgi:hypothetical protein